MTADAYVRACIDQGSKDDVAAVLHSLGLTVSDVRRIARLKRTLIVK